jgi:hypothetical protein
VLSIFYSSKIVSPSYLNWLAWKTL